MIHIDVNKGIRFEQVNKYISEKMEHNDVSISIQIGDTPETSTFAGNDGPMLNTPIGISVSDK